jgi:plastocyanin
MKNFIFVLLVAALAASLFTPEIKAADTLKVPLTLNVDKIETNIQTAYVKPGQFVQFYTDGDETFNVTIVNDNNFFNIDSDVISFSVQKGKSHTYQVGTSKKQIEAKISPFGLVEPNDIEIVPTAPPRIIIAHNE